MWKSLEQLSSLKNINSKYRGSPQALEISARDIELLPEEDNSDMLIDDEFWQDKKILERIDSTGKIFSIQPEKSLNFSSLFNSFWLIYRSNVYVHEVLKAFVTLDPKRIGPWRLFDPLGKLEIDSEGLLKITANPKVPMRKFKIHSLKPTYMISGIEQESGKRVYLLLTDLLKDIESGIKITKVKPTNTRVSGIATVLEEEIVVVTILKDLVTVNFEHNSKYYTFAIDVGSSIPEIVESTIKTKLETSDATINDLIELKTSDATINKLIQLYKSILDFRKKVFEPLTYVKNLSDDVELSIDYFDLIKKNNDETGIRIEQSELNLAVGCCVTENILKSSIDIKEELINSLEELIYIMERSKEPMKSETDESKISILYAINPSLIVSTKFCQNFNKDTYHYYLLSTPFGENSRSYKNKFDLLGLADQTRAKWGWFVAGINKHLPDVQPPVLQPEVAASLRAMLDATTPQ